MSPVPDAILLKWLDSNDMSGEADAMDAIVM
jgi:hypothetical protein